MIRVYILLIIILSSTSLCVLGQVKKDTILYWNKNRKLEYSDFQGKVPDSTGFKVAVAPAEIIVKGFFEDGMLNFKVEVYFLKNIAWMIDSSENTMIHEQLHFDIAELYGRKIRKGILELRKTHQASSEKCSKLIQELLDARNMKDVQYDQETAHGVYINKQKEWNKKIKQELEELKEFAIDYDENNEK